MNFAFTLQAGWEASGLMLGITLSTEVLQPLSGALLSLCLAIPPLHFRSERWRQWILQSGLSIDGLHGLRESGQSSGD